jgi:exodeoxyribonuclease V alpha subunit
MVHNVHSYKHKLKEIEQSDLQIHIGDIETSNNVHYAPSQKDGA